MILKNDNSEIMMELQPKFAKQPIRAHWNSVSRFLSYIE